MRKKKYNTINKLPWFLFAIISLGLFASCKKDLKGGEIKTPEFRSSNGDCAISKNYITRSFAHTRPWKGGIVDDMNDIEIACYAPTKSKTKISLCINESGSYTLNMNFLTPENDIPDLKESPPSDIPEAKSVISTNGMVQYFDANQNLIRTDEESDFFADLLPELFEGNSISKEEFITGQRANGFSVNELDNNMVSVEEIDSETGDKYLYLYDFNLERHIGTTMNLKSKQEIKTINYTYTIHDGEYRINKAIAVSMFKSFHSALDLITQEITEYEYL